MSNYVLEHIIAKTYGWSLEAIRDMPLSDFWPHLRICMVSEEADKEYQARLAGAEIPDEEPTGDRGIVGDGKDAKPEDFKLPPKGESRGTIKTQKEQKLLKFQGKVRETTVREEDIKIAGVDEWNLMIQQEEEIKYNRSKGDSE